MGRLSVGRYAAVRKVDFLDLGVNKVFHVCWKCCTVSAF